MRFTDRHQAGLLLARALRPYLEKPSILYALPRGGVPVAVEIALESGAPLELVIARKIGHPRQPEFAMGAVTETGDPVFGEEGYAPAEPGWLQAQVEQQRAEARRRRLLYCAGRPRRSAAGQRAILVDDGIATGLTMLAAIAELKRDAPSELIVAVPVAPPEAVSQFSTQADRFVCVHVPQIYAGAVGYYYDDFRQVSDQDVLDELQRLRRGRGSTPKSEAP